MNFWWSTTQFFLCIVFTGNFLYFALMHLRHDRELGHQARCSATSDLNHPIIVTKDTDKDLVTDVGRQFYLLFMSGLCLNIFTAIWSVVACFISESRMTCNYAMQSIIFVANIIFLVSVTLARAWCRGRWWSLL